MLMLSKIKYHLCLILMSRSSPHRITSAKSRMSTTPSSICIWPAKTKELVLLYTLGSSKASWKHTKHCRTTSTISILEMLRSLSKRFMMHALTARVRTLSTTSWTSYQETWKTTTVTCCSICTKEHLTNWHHSIRVGEIKWLEFPHTQ